jgi:tryptophan synthase alpha chain
MSRIQHLFAKKSNRVLNIYCTAGYPTLNSTVGLMETLQQHGADIIELGMPYSDPLADGAVIQASSNIAIANGLTIPVLFEQLKNFRQTIHIPVILMGYMNPVLQYGFERFCKDAAALGIDGLILPDLPEYEYETEYGQILQAAKLDFIFLVTPETSAERVLKLDALSGGFLYAVSSSSTTGTEKNMTSVNNYMNRLASYQLKNPVLVGFGIKDKADFDAACTHAAGAIIGTAFIKAITSVEDVNKATSNFMQSVLSEES